MYTLKYTGVHVYPVHLYVGEALLKLILVDSKLKILV